MINWQQGIAHPFLPRILTGKKRVDSNSVTKDEKGLLSNLVIIVHTDYVILAFCQKLFVLYLI